MKNKIEIGVKHLLESDKIISGLIKRLGPCTIEKRNDYFESLTRSIISQQLSNIVSRNIFQRLYQITNGHIHPDVILNLGLSDLRKIGISNQKTITITLLADSILKNPDYFNTISNDSNQDVINKLIKFHGIGEWTAQMFLIFCLGRLDVLPLNDTGFRRSIEIHYKLQKKPSDREIIVISRNWDRYSSIAAWYLWKGLDSY
jgi:DNA-3-methyladenine glycosylase II